MEQFKTKRPISEGAEEILSQYFPVLDHGFISCIDYMSNDSGIEQAARVSYGAGTRKVSQTRGLLRYLKRHHHSTPYEMVELKFHVCMPIFVARQWIRHRASTYSSINEYSGRYSLMPMIFYTPQKEQFQKQSKSNNQGRSEQIDEQKYIAAVDYWNEIRKKSSSLYEDLVGDDVARELARIDLPLSTYTQWYWKIDLHNLLHFLTLRADAHAQWEIREYAKIIAGMIKKISPLAYEAWIDYQYGSVNLSRMEIEVLRNFMNCDLDDDGSINFFPSSDVLHVDDKDGLSKRELKEMYNKFQKIEIPNFELDLSQAKSPEYFEQKMIKAVPKVDR